MHLLRKINTCYVFLSSPHFQKVLRTHTHKPHPYAWHSYCIALFTPLPALHANLYRLGESRWPSWMNVAREQDGSRQRALSRPWACAVQQFWPLKDPQEASGYCSYNPIRERKARYKSRVRIKWQTDSCGRLLVIRWVAEVHVAICCTSCFTHVSPFNVWIFTFIGWCVLYFPDWQNFQSEAVRFRINVVGEWLHFYFIKSAFMYSALLLMPRWPVSSHWLF